MSTQAIESAHLKTITAPSGAKLPEELSLLRADVVLEAPHKGPQITKPLPLMNGPEFGAPPEPERVGQVAGVVVGDAGEVQHFIVRLDRGGERILVPAQIVTTALEAGSMTVRVPWTKQQISTQPRVRADGTLYEQLRSDITRVPPSGGFLAKLALKEGAVGLAVGAAMGGIAGAVAGEPLIGASLALFLGLGGAIAGAMSGGGRELAADAARHDLEPVSSKDGGVALLERGLRHAARTRLRALRVVTVLADRVTDGVRPRGVEGILAGGEGS